MRILIADDEELLAELLASAAARLGHEVRTVSSGLAALERGGEEAPDLLVVDWMLSDGIDGVEVAERLHAVHPELRVILMTGFPSAELQGRTARLDLVTCLKKPFELPDFRDALEQAATSLAR